MKTTNTDYLLNLKGLTVRTKKIAEKEKSGSKLKALKDTLHEQVKAMYLSEKKKIASTFNLICETERLNGHKLELDVVENKLREAC